MSRLPPFFAVVFIFAFASIFSACVPSDDPKLSLQLDYQLYGQQHSYITVIFETGVVPLNFVDAKNVNWGKIAPRVGESARVLIYSRAGLGKSQNSPLARTVDNINLELRTLLNELELPPPYVLVGHSFGSHLIHYFARQNPEEVLGLVLVEPTPQNMRQSCIEDQLGGDNHYAVEICDEFIRSMDAFQNPGKAEMQNIYLSDQLIQNLPPLTHNPPISLFLGPQLLPSFPPYPSAEQWQERYPGLGYVSNQQRYQLLNSWQRRLALQSDDVEIQEFANRNHLSIIDETDAITDSIKRMIDKVRP